MIKFKHTSKQK